MAVADQKEVISKVLIPMEMAALGGHLHGVV
jgi:hypothetical protein